MQCKKRRTTTINYQQSPLMENHPSQLWDNCLSIIHDNISQQMFDTWFKCINLCSFEDHKLTLGVPSAFVYEYVEEHFLDLLRKTITKVFAKYLKTHKTQSTPKSNHQTKPAFNPYTIHVQQTPVQNPSGRLWPTTSTHSSILTTTSRTLSKVPATNSYEASERPLAEPPHAPSTRCSSTATLVWEKRTW